MSVLDTLSSKLALAAQATYGWTPTQFAAEMRKEGEPPFKFAERIESRSIEEHAAVVAAREQERSSGFTGWLNENVAPAVRRAGPVALGALFTAAAVPMLGTMGGRVAGTLVSGLTSARPARPQAPTQGVRSMGPFDSNTFDLGQTVLGGLNSYLQYRLQERAQSAALPMAMPGAPAVTSVAFPALPSLGGLGARLGIGAAAGAAARVGGRILTAAGTWITSRRAVRLAKLMGVQAAATALGIGAIELAELVVADSARARRGRGVTAAQLRTTRRTMRVVSKMNGQIARYAAQAKRTCR